MALEEELNATSAQLFAFYEELRTALTERDAAYVALARAQRNTLLRLASAAELRDGETGHHMLRVSKYSYLLATALELDETFCNDLRLASPIHDIGKLGVPDAILKKPGRLTVGERRIMQKHPSYGASLLTDAETPMMRLAAEVALGHHERYDGGGYPQGLATSEIPTSCRIVALADFFDAMTSDRVYRPAFEIDYVVDSVLEAEGKHFDPEVVSAFRIVSDEFYAVHASKEDLDANTVFDVKPFEVDRDEAASDL